MSTLIPSDLPLPSGAAPSARAEEAVPVSVSVGTSRRTGAAQGRAGDAEPVRHRHSATGLIEAKERQHLGRLGRQAWEKCGAKGAGIPCDEWRHEQIELATEGKATCLHNLRRGQYKDVLRHFLELAGDSARAFRVAMRSGQGAADRDLAFAKLREACEAGELAYPEYPESICRRQFKCALDELETGKVWFLFYTCNTRARQKMAKAAEGDLKGGGQKSAVVTLENGSEAGNPVGGLGEGPF